MTTMTEEMGTALIEAMVVEGHQVHIVGVEVALTMGMELSQVLDNEVRGSPEYGRAESPINEKRYHR